jgi:exodeoxyribonuclease V alpha subunit
MDAEVRPKVELSGEVRDVLFENEENGYAVLRVDVLGLPLPITVTGHLYGLSPGARLKLRGEYKDHPRFGRQFVAEWHEEVRPGTGPGMIAYLASQFRGIGSALAERIVEHFGDQTYEVLDADPSRVREVEGVGRKKAKKIAEAWNERRAIREAATFLMSYGVTSGQVSRLFTQYGDATVGLVKANPYRLADEVRGIGFKTADRIAQALGVPRDSPERARAALLYLLGEAQGQGHTLLPKSEVIRRAEALDVVEAATLGAIEALTYEGAVHEIAAPPGRAAEVLPDGWDRLGPCLYLARMLHDEDFVAKMLAAGGRITFEFPEALSRVARAAQAAGLELAPEQEAAIVRSLTHKVAVITGGPGVGKTTIVRLLAAILLEEDVEVGLCAPTGRAAKRLSEATGRSASTIHRLLKFDPMTGGFAFGEVDRLEVDHLIVDECSMLDVPLAASLLRALPDHARLTMVGDADQLPSVGPGDFFRAVCATRGIDVTRLERVFRQREGSRIVAGAHSVHHGEMPAFDPPGAGGEFFLVERDNPDTIAETIRHLVVERIPAAYGLDPRTEVQVLTPMHKGSAGAEMLNEVLGKALNPDPEAEVKRAGRVLRVGDRVVQIKNDYKKAVFNGDQGFVIAIDTPERRLVARIDEAEIVYDFEELTMLLPAFATTVHRAQGGEHKAVVIALSQQHYPMLRRNLIYTAITRAKQLCVIVGSRRALERAIATSATSDRYCWLEERLDGESRGVPDEPRSEIGSEGREHG